MQLVDHVTDRAEGRIGTVLRGKWKLERIVGVGGMATVYAATHRNKSRVAIKVLHPELAIDAEVTARFLREGYVANAVDHPGTVKVIDDDLTEDGAPFLVMELLDGETLDARLNRKGRLDAGEVLAIANQVLGVLEAAHQRGVVHRDLKPENLFLTRQGELKILDFGIARLRELTPDGSSTRAGSLLGTPAFMAPEQARGRWDDVDARTDIWAVGATIFSLLTGRHVHEAETVQEQLIKSATTAAQSLGEVLPSASVAVVTLVDRSLAFDRMKRFDDAKQMRLALLAAVGLSEGDAPLSLPTPSTPGLMDAQTLVAPPELASVITGQSLTQSHGYSTARPVTTGVSSVSSPPGNPRLRLVAGATLAALLIGGGGVTWFTSRAPTASDATGPATAAVAATPPRTQLEPAPAPVESPSPTVAPAQPAPVASAPPKPRVSGHKPTPSPPPAAVPAPPSTATLVTPKPAAPNPFDKRL
ncbi:MAG: serine/threonine protein kinase [Myxococcales bacterium]|nr:serine/threonine protein kinase [Myxococcales bacterium]